MEIYDGSGEPFIETEEEQAFLDLMTQFYFSNRRRYKKQAKKLLREGLLLVEVGDSIIKYTIEDEGVVYRFSDDQGVTFSNTLGLTPLHWRKSIRLARLREKFAHSEARLITDL